MAGQTGITSLADILAGAGRPAPIELDCGAAGKGVDNYHIDVQLSPAFVLLSRELIEDQVRRAVTGNRLISANSREMGEFRDAYSDMLKITLHRYKTDLTLEQIPVLQFAVVKYILQAVRSELDEYESQLEETRAQQQFSGSRSLLTTQERMTWFRKNAGDFLFRINRLMLRQLQRADNNQLRLLRMQILGEGFPVAVNVMFNPMLFSRSPLDPVLLLEHYVWWPGGRDGFEKILAVLESSFAEYLPDLSFQGLKQKAGTEASATEIYDELGGLFAVQKLMGSCEDQKDKVSERFSWLDEPGNMRLLFDPAVLDRHVAQVKQEGGLKAQWSLKSDVKKLLKISQEIRKRIAGVTSLRSMLATYTLREKLTSRDLEMISVDDAVAIVAGEGGRLLSSINTRQENGPALVRKLEELAEEFDQRYRDSEDEWFLKLMTDFTRYRMHLKYYRFAHRIFNRISIITEPEKIELAKAGGNLYRLMNSEEVRQVASEQPDIVHHTILKADVRGSTTVTQELIRQDLNPASYFSLRFFGPITERLATYGAVKVFIEGDAIILGTYEYEGQPSQWYSVSRACGMAKEMLDIVGSKNAHAGQTGLPYLEIGIGICYSDERPLFLFDDKRRIMISSAIGDADRMSSCSWRLRSAFEADEFNVEVLEIDDSDRQKGEKGQNFIRYNVNGILLDDAAFAKLQSEIRLTRLKVKAGEKSETVHVGRFPDVQGKERHLVVREGAVGLWKDETVHENPGSDAVFYEVLPNSKRASQIIKLAESRES